MCLIERLTDTISNIATICVGYRLTCTLASAQNIGVATFCSHVFTIALAI